MKTAVAALRRRLSASTPDGLVVGAMMVGALIAFAGDGRLAGVAGLVGL